MAAPLGRSVDEASYGVLAIANALMARSVRSVITSRGRDPRDFTLLALGGGGLHAVGLAASLGMRRVIIPLASGVFSAFSLLYSEIEFAQSRGFLAPLDDADPAKLDKASCALETSVLHHLGRPSETVRLRRRVDLRYAGQAFELAVDMPDGAFDTAMRDTLASVFDEEYARSYGHSLPRARLREIVTLRVIGMVIAERPESRLPARPRQGSAAARPAYFGEDGGVEARIVERRDLATPLNGRLIIEEPDAAIIIPLGWTAGLDDRLNILIDQTAELPA